MDSISFDLQLEAVNKVTEHFLFLDDTMIWWALPFRAPSRGGWWVVGANVTLFIWEMVLCRILCLTPTHTHARYYTRDKPCMFLWVHPHAACWQARTKLHPSRKINTRGNTEPEKREYCILFTSWTVFHCPALNVFVLLEACLHLGL